MCPLTGPYPARPSMRSWVGPRHRELRRVRLRPAVGHPVDYEHVPRHAEVPEIVVGVYPSVDIAVGAALGSTGETSAAEPHPPPMGDSGIPHPPADSADSDDLVADGRDADELRSVPAAPAAVPPGVKRARTTACRAPAGHRAPGASRTIPEPDGGPIRGFHPGPSGPRPERSPRPSPRC